MTQASLLADLQSIVGADHAYPPKERWSYIVDGLTPSVVVSPGSYDEVAEVLRLANERRLAVIPGRPSVLMMVGNVPHRYDIALSLERLDRILEHEPADLTVTCQAGIQATNLNASLAKSGQMVPFGLEGYPYGYIRGSVGALLAANHSGLQLRFGLPRDFTIGMRVVTADGRITKAGGKVVKNVAGFDMCKLFVGSRGTLGVIVEVTLKVAMLPEEQQEIDLEFTSAAAACRFAWELFRRGLSIHALSVEHGYPSDAVEWSPEPRSIYVLKVYTAGSATAIRYSLREIERLSATGGVRQYRRPDVPAEVTKKGAWEQGTWLECEASLLPTQLPALIDAFAGETPSAHIWHGDPIIGTVRALWLGSANDGALLQRVREATANLGGALTVHDCDPALKRQIDVFGDVPPKTLDLMRRIKHQFDPNGILSPGRFVGKL
jgi:glycolate oxidase FAD binding subunit